MPDWRRWLIYTHRWLGIAGSVLFVVWFASGLVLVYARMPRLSAEERLSRLAPLDLSTAAASPAAAAARAGGKPTRLRVGMLHSRPVYRFLVERRWVAVFADTGELVAPLTADDAIALAREFAPESASDAPTVATLTDADQWTLTGGLRSAMPLHRIALDDDAGTELYVAAEAGEIVTKTTRSARRWGFAGAVLHWLYFAPLRRHGDLWSNVVIWTSVLGCLLSLSGLVVGVWRLSPRRRFRLRGVERASPYAGLMRWHHYAGLGFGLTTFTWMLSGLLSMTPWDWNAGTSPSRPQRDGAAGGTYSLAGISADGLRMALRTLSAAFVIKEIEVLQVDGERFYRAYRTPERDQAGLWTNTDLEGYLTPQTTLEERLLSVDQPSAPPFRAFDRARIERAAQAAMPGVVFESLVWLEEFDDYYYGRSGSRPLPVLRARFRDAEATALYLDPRSGEIVRREDRRTRIERWLYHGLHSLDVAWLYRRRPLWDIVVVGLSAGGLVLCASSAAHAWHRLRRHARRMWPSRTDV